LEILQQSKNVDISNEASTLITQLECE